MLPASAFFYFLLPFAISRFCTEPTSPKDISCYDDRKKFLPILKKDFLAPKHIIYFIESSCKGELQSRYACAIESAARANPKRHVAVLFAGPLKPEFRRSKLFRTLNAIPNLFFYRIYPKHLATRTPLERVFSGNSLKYSKYPVVFAADMLRILILYLFGGLYLDLDMIVLRSFDTLPNNFLAHEDRDSIGSAIIAAANDETGRKFTNISIRIAAEHYDANTWASNSNENFRRTLVELCNTDYFVEMKAENCEGFHLFDSDWFYPHFLKYYERQFVPMPEGGGKVYTHHLWNSWGQQVRVAPDSFFSDLAATYCPKTYNLYKDKFGE